MILKLKDLLTLNRIKNEDWRSVDDKTWDEIKNEAKKKGEPNIFVKLMNKKHDSMERDKGL
jgi:hypothetical protein